MPKTDAERNRAKEARKKNAGLHEYRVWAAGKDGGRDPEIGAALNARADELTIERWRGQMTEEQQWVVNVANRCHFGLLDDDIPTASHVIAAHECVAKGWLVDAEDDCHRHTYKVTEAGRFMAFD